jgi:hypothetical protein
MRTMRRKCDRGVGVPAKMTTRMRTRTRTMNHVLGAGARVMRRMTTRRTSSRGVCHEGGGATRRMTIDLVCEAPVISHQNNLNASTRASKTAKFNNSLK